MRSWEAGCVPYSVFSPDAFQIGNPTPARGHSPANRHIANQHMGGVLVPLENGGAYINFGDAEKDDEVRMSAWAESLGVTKRFPRILKLSHHGALTSTRDEVLKNIQPNLVWISVGAGNRYGHPSLEILERVRSWGIPFYRTDELGSLSLFSMDYRFTP